MAKNKPNLTVIDENIYDVVIRSTPPTRHQGYSPVCRGVILGRYKFYEVAAAKASGNPVLTYEDACRQAGVTCHRVGSF